MTYTELRTMDGRHYYKPVRDQSYGEYGYRVTNRDDVNLLETTRFIPDHNIAELISETELPDERRFVQVKFGPYESRRTYTYVDPGLDLQVGDIVLIDTVYQDNAEAEVIALGKGWGYDGPYKAVKALAARAVSAAA